MVSVMKHLTDLSHVLYGFITGLLVLNNYLNLSLLGIASYLIYQLLDYLIEDTLQNTLGDLKEFMLGFCTSIAVYGVALLVPNI